MPIDKETLIVFQRSEMLEHYLVSIDPITRTIARTVRLSPTLDPSTQEHPSIVKHALNIINDNIPRIINFNEYSIPKYNPSVTTMDYNTRMESGGLATLNFRHQTLDPATLHFNNSPDSDRDIDISKFPRLNDYKSIDHPRPDIDVSMPQLNIQPPLDLPITGFHLRSEDVLPANPDVYPRRKMEEIDKMPKMLHELREEESSNQPENSSFESEEYMKLLKAKSPLKRQSPDLLPRIIIKDKPSTATKRLEMNSRSQSPNKSRSPQRASPSRALSNNKGSWKTNLKSKDISPSKSKPELWNSPYNNKVILNMNKDKDFFKYAKSPPRTNHAHPSHRTADAKPGKLSRAFSPKTRARKSAPYKGELDTVEDLYTFIVQYYKSGGLMRIENREKRRLAALVVGNRIPDEMRVFVWMMLSGADKEIEAAEKDFEITDEAVNMVKAYRNLFEDLAFKIEPDRKMAEPVGEWSFYIFVGYVTRHTNLNFLQHLERRHFLVPLVYGYRRSVATLKSRNCSEGVTPEMKRELCSLYRRYYERPHEEKGFRHGDGLNIYHIFQECSNNFKYANSFKPHLWTDIFNDMLRTFAIEDKELKEAMFGATRESLPCVDVQQFYRTLLYPELTPNPLQTIDLYFILGCRTVEFIFISKSIYLREEILLSLSSRRKDPSFTHTFRNDILPQMLSLDLSEVSRPDIIDMIIHDYYGEDEDTEY